MIAHTLVALSEDDLNELVKERASLIDNIGRRELTTSYPRICELLNDLRYRWKNDD